MKSFIEKIAVLIIVIGFISPIETNAQSIKLPKPNLNNTSTVGYALKVRHSERKYSNKNLSKKDLSNLLWAANGINRDNGKRTAPSAVNAQDVEIYVLRSDGAYFYNPKENILNKVSNDDIRITIAGHNKFIMDAPIVLLLISDQSKFKRFGDRAKIFGAMDAGYVSQNICLFCASVNMITVPCAPPIDADFVQQALNLNSDKLPLIYHPVGYVIK